MLVWWSPELGIYCQYGVFQKRGMDDCGTAGFSHGLGDGHPVSEHFI